MQSGVVDTMRISNPQPVLTSPGGQRENLLRVRLRTGARFARSHPGLTRPGLPSAAPPALLLGHASAACADPVPYLPPFRRELEALRAEYEEATRALSRHEFPFYEPPFRAGMEAECLFF